MKKKYKFLNFSLFLFITYTCILTNVSARTPNNEEYKDSSQPIEKRVSALLKSMTLDEKVGQMVMAERRTLSPGDIKKYGIGAVLSGGGSAPPQNNPQAWQEMYNSYQNEALTTRLGIPIMYGIDAVHGHSTVIGATIFPHNIGLGATRNGTLIKKIGEITAREVKATGLNWNFGPCVAVTRDERWGRSYESYGESPDLQKILTANYVKGLQQEGIIACAKHFLGDGGAEWLTGEKETVDRGNITEIDIVTLKDIHAQGYIEAIKAQTGTIMASFSSFQSQHMHGHTQLLSEYLKGPESKGGLNFKGFVCGDWDGMSELYKISPHYKDKVIASFNAGIDMAMEQDKWKTVINILKDGVQSGSISPHRIDDAVSRILTVKFRFNLFEHALANTSTPIGTPENREIAAQAVRESLVLLKNKNDLLPLKKSSKIFVTGPLADHIGAQCGGWTVTWQGIAHHNKSLFPGATSILDGICAMLNENKGQCIVNPKKAASADAAIVVVGELPYSEWMGDIKIKGTMRPDDLQSKCSSTNREALNTASGLGIPVIVIIISGRPLIITDEIKKWDSCIAAWLPGSEGAAIAELLFGNHNFKGTLPVTWPKSIKQLPINADDPGYGKAGKKPLFPYGFGLKMNL